jgi:hypothetical protein
MVPISRIGHGRLGQVGQEDASSPAPIGQCPGGGAGSGAPIGLPSPALTSTSCDVGTEGNQRLALVERSKSS